MKNRSPSPLQRVAVYPGTFDPVTNGHLDIARRATRLFDRVIIAVATEMEKAPLFSVEERKALLADSVKRWRNVEVDSFEGLLVDYVRRKNACAVVRGLRAVSDFEYEFQMALMNRRLDKTVETIFLMPKDTYAFLSSRLVKQIATLGGNVSPFVPPLVVKKLRDKVRS
jgi:pantetheine-phosphate adenylyltransferase